MFQWIQNHQDELKTDFVTWTGDNSAHNTWNNSQAEVDKYTEYITSLWKTTVGTLGKAIPMFPVQGNHDTWPVNIQDFTKPGSNISINELSKAWSDPNWLSADEISVFSQYGYYSKPFPFNAKGKIIAINMQSCNNLNWYLLEERNDPGHQIEWLEKELQTLESN